MEGIADPNTNAPSNVADFDKLNTTPVLQCLGHLFPGGSSKIDVDNFISFAPNIKMTVPPKPRVSNHSQPKSRNVVHGHTHKIILDTLTDIMKSLEKEIMTDSRPLSSSQAELETRLIRNLHTTRRLLADQRRLIKIHYNFFNGTEEYAPTTSALEKARTANVQRRRKEVKICSQSSKLRKLMPWLVEKHGEEIKNLKKSVCEFKAEKEEKSTSSTSPQVFFSQNSSETSGAGLSWSTQQSWTKSKNNSLIPDINLSSEEAETSSDSSTSDQEEDSSSSSSSESLNIYLSEQSESNSLYIKREAVDVGKRNPPSLSQNAQGSAKTGCFNKDSGVKIALPSNREKIPQKSKCGEINSSSPRNRIRSGLFAAQNANAFRNDSNVSKIKKILPDLARNHTNEKRSTSLSPSNKVKSSRALEVARIIALLLKSCGFSQETKDVAREIGKILSPESYAEDDAPLKLAKGMANITIRVDDLHKLAPLLGNGSNATHISNVKSESAERTSVPVNRLDQACQVGTTLPSRSNEVNSANYSGVFGIEKKVATLNLYDPYMESVEGENHAQFSQPEKFTSPDSSSGINEKLQTCKHLNLKANAIPATCESLNLILTVRPSTNKSVNANIQKPSVEVGNKSSFIDVRHEFQHFPRNETDSDEVLHAPQSNEGSTKTSQLSDAYSFKPNSEKDENKTDAMEPGVSNSVVELNNSSVNSETESISSSIDSFVFVDISSGGGEKSSFVSVSGAPDTNDNSNSLVGVHDAATVNLEENGSAHRTSKSNSAQSENKDAGQHEQGAVNTCSQRSELNSSGTAEDERIFPFRMQEPECCNETLTANSFKDLVSPSNCETVEDYSTSNNREPVAGLSYHNTISCALEDDSCRHYGGPMDESFPVASDPNGFTNYVPPPANGKTEYYGKTTHEMELNDVWSANTANCNVYQDVNSLTNIGTVPTYPNSQKLELDTNNPPYPASCQIPMKWIDLVNSSFTSDYGRYLPYGVPCPENYNSYGNTNNYVANETQWETNFTANYNAPMMTSPATRRKYASHDPGNDRHLTFEPNNHEYFRANSEPNHFSNFDYLRNNIENEALAATANYQEHIPVNVGNTCGGGGSLPQIYGTNSTCNSISAKGYVSEVSQSNLSSRFNDTSLSSISSRSRITGVSSEVQSAKVTNVPCRVSQSSIEDGSSRASASFPASLFYEAHPSDPSQI
nr:hypothetical protein HmN_000668700 [Hymenolepis microstoma]